MRHGIRYTQAPAGSGPRRHVPNEGLRHRRGSRTGRGRSRRRHSKSRRHASPKTTKLYDRTADPAGARAARTSSSTATVAPPGPVGRPPRPRRVFRNPRRAELEGHQELPPRGGLTVRPLSGTVNRPRHSGGRRVVRARRRHRAHPRSAAPTGRAAGSRTANRLGDPPLRWRHRPSVVFCEPRRRSPPRFAAQLAAEEICNFFRPACSVSAAQSPL